MNDENWICPLCGKKFESLFQLTHHLRKSHGEFPLTLAIRNPFPVTL